MLCRDVQKLFSPYLDGFLSPEERRMVEEHVANCSGCYQELSSLKDTVEAVRNLGTVEPPPNFCEELHFKLHEGKKKKQNAKWKLYFSGIAAAVLVIFLALHAVPGIFQGVRGLSPQKEIMSQSSQRDDAFLSREHAPMEEKAGIQAVPEENAEFQEGKNGQLELQQSPKAASKNIALVVDNPIEAVDELKNKVRDYDVEILNVEYVSQQKVELSLRIPSEDRADIIDCVFSIAKEDKARSEELFLKSEGTEEFSSGIVLELELNSP